VYLGDKQISIHEVSDRLHQQGTDPAHQVIYLRADESVPFGVFASLMDAVKQAGITNVSIVTQPLEAKAAPAPVN
jgi:biopolymer transport protein ExbD/biopolymer transport protein TolR